MARHFLLIAIGSWRSEENPSRPRRAPKAPARPATAAPAPSISLDRAALLQLQPAPMALHPQSLLTARSSTNKNTSFGRPFDGHAIVKARRRGRRDREVGHFAGPDILGPDIRSASA